jgi:hypothetical protein
VLLHVCVCCVCALSCVLLCVVCAFIFFVLPSSPLPSAKVDGQYNEDHELDKYIDLVTHELVASGEVVVGGAGSGATKKKKKTSKRRKQVKCGYCKAVGYHNVRNCDQRKGDEARAKKLAASVHVLQKERE